MATITNSQTTATAVGVREDLTDRIHRVDVEDTPFKSRVGTADATQPLHEWQTRLLGAVDDDNAKPEGNETSREPSTQNARINNVCQISDKNATTSGTIEASDLAGRNREMALQMADRAIELRKDCESISLGNQAFDNSGEIRRMRGFEAWIRTNSSRGEGGADPADPNTTPGTTATDGEPRPFTEELWLDNLQEIYEAGGEARFALMGPFAKRTASKFIGREQARQMIGEQRIQQATNMFATDFGDIEMVPHRYLRSNGRTVYNIDPNYVKIAYLRRMARFPLAKIGDADTRVILSEYTLEMCNERAHGVVADLQTTAQ
ncbi:MAG: DUF5309 family protein [Pseudomonadota bacterium]